MKYDRHMFPRRFTTMSSVETDAGPRQRCGACGNMEFFRPFLELPFYRYCPACGRVISVIIKLDPARTPSDAERASIAAFLNSPRSQNNLRPRLRHAHGARR